MTPSRPRLLRWICVLPALHLCFCFLTVVGGIKSGWEYLSLYIDYPISVLILSVLYRFDHPLLLFGTIGTLWWLALSWLAMRLATSLAASLRKTSS